MSDRYKILRQASTTTSPLGAAYVTPNPDTTTVGPADEVEVAPKATSLLTQVKVTSVIACRTDNSAVDISILLQSALGVSANQTYLLFEQDLGGYETKVFDFGMVLSPGNTLWFGSSAAVDFTLMGIETTIGVGPNA